MGGGGDGDGRDGGRVGGGRTHDESFPREPVNTEDKSNTQIENRNFLNILKAKNRNSVRNAS